MNNPTVKSLELHILTFVMKSHTNIHILIWLCLVIQWCLTLCNPINCSSWGSWVHGDSPGKNTGVGCHTFLQGIFPTQGSNPSLLHCMWILYCLRRQGSPRILEWVAYPFSRGSSHPRNWTKLYCTAGEFFTSWATREADKSTKQKTLLCTF